MQRNDLHMVLIHVCDIYITTKLLDFVHRPDFYKPENTTFRKLDLFPSSGKGGRGTYSTEKQNQDDGQIPEA
jgi:hypothetical protein